MPAKTFQLEFKGYWREPNISGIPAEGGVFCAYTCTFNETDKTVSIHKLLYIGGSENVRAAVASQESLEAWRIHKTGGQQLCFNFAPTEDEARERVEAALIFQHKPLGNVKYRDAFPFPKTSVGVKGMGALLQPEFTVSREGG